MFELLNLLTDSEKQMVIVYAIGGAFLVLNSYVVYQAKLIDIFLRISITVLMCSTGFSFLSASGRILKGYDGTLTSFTQWGVVIATATSFWVVWELKQRCLKKIKGNEQKN